MLFRLCIFLAGTMACCGDSTSGPPPVNVPKRQIVLENLRIEERDNEQLVWQGFAKHGEGDTSMLWVRDVILHRKAQGQSDLTMQAPRGKLWLDEKRAVMATPHIVDNNGGTLDAQEADYRESKGTILCRGPLEYMARGLRINAPEGTFFLEDGSMEIKGPVIGRFDPHSPPPPARHPL